VRFPGITHPGIIGTAPSMELLNIWNERERDVEENGLQSLKLCEVLHSRPLANLPTTKSCLLGKVINKYVLIPVSYIFYISNVDVMQIQITMGEDYLYIILRPFSLHGCRLKKVVINGRRLQGKQQEQYREEKTAEIVT
jgi:hypothetical protein